MDKFTKNYKRKPDQRKLHSRKWTLRKKPDINKTKFSKIDTWRKKKLDITLIRIKILYQYKRFFFSNSHEFTQLTPDAPIIKKNQLMHHTKCLEAFVTTSSMFQFLSCILCSNKCLFFREEFTWSNVDITNSLPPFTLTKYLNLKWWI